MIRFIILIGYMGLMMYLQISGELNQYINIHYNYLAVLSFIMAIVQLILWNQADPSMQKKHEDMHQHGGHEHHGHQHNLEKPSQRGLAYLLLSLPLIVGLLFPTVSLDTTIVEAKNQ